MTTAQYKLALEDARIFDRWNAMQDKSKDLSRNRGLAFVSLFAASKQLVDNFPKRYPYLEYWVRWTEKEGLAPKLEREENR